MLLDLTAQIAKMERITTMLIEATLKWTLRDKLMTQQHKKSLYKEEKDQTSQGRQQSCDCLRTLSLYYN